MPVKNKIDDINPHRLAQSHGQIKVVTQDGIRIHRVLTLIELLHTRGQITPEQYRSGTWFYRDWYNSGLSGSKAIDYSKIRVDVSVVNHSSHNSLDAMTRFKNAVSGIGRVHSHPLFNMILLEQSPEEYGFTRCGQRNPKLARLAAITLLTSALEALHEHYSTK